MRALSAYIRYVSYRTNVRTRQVHFHSAPCVLKLYIAGTVQKVTDFCVLTT